jgi:non-heme chloroperoxidase
MQETSFEGYGGLRLAADIGGDADGPPVLLLHGGGQTRHAWGTTAEVLASGGWRVASLDLRGHGDSEWDPDGDYRIDAFAGDVRAVAAELTRPDGLRPALVGASLGGISAMIAQGEADPDAGVASAVVLVDVAHRLETSGVRRIAEFMTAHLAGFDDLEAVADAVAAYNPHRPRPTDLAGLRKNVRQRDDGRWYWHWDPRFVTGQLGSADETRSDSMTSTRLRDAAGGLGVPTLLVRGRMSDLLSEEGARELLDLLPGARYVDVAGAGHMVAGDRNDAFNDAVVQFLADGRADR